MAKNYIYFNPVPRTAEELKKSYRQLCMEHHPDRGGNSEIMKAINNEYDELFPILKDIHQNKDGETYTARESTTETADQFKDIIDELMKLEKIEIEQIGCFLWVSGETKPHKEKLKSLNFNYHSKKKCWFLPPENYRKKSRKDYDLDEIREMYGSSGSVKSKGTVKINEAER